MRAALFLCALLVGCSNPVEAKPFALCGFERLPNPGDIHAGAYNLPRGPKQKVLWNNWGKEYCPACVVRKPQPELELLKNCYVRDRYKT